ncbi:MAG: hypothetical protein ABI923_04135 [bacterium]
MSPSVYKGWAIIGEIERDRFWNTRIRELTDVSPPDDAAAAACIRNGYIPVIKKHSRSLSNAC